MQNIHMVTPLARALNIVWQSPDRPPLTIHSSFAANGCHTMDANTFTPVRQTRTPISIAQDDDDSPQPPSSLAGVPNTDASSSSTDVEAQLRAQLLQMKAQMVVLQNQLTSSNGQLKPRLSSSREYWALPIPDTIKYPGEDSSKTAKLAYMQRLHSYLRKSQPIWDLVSGKTPCPLAGDLDAIAALQASFGSMWTFSNKDLTRSMRVLQSNAPAVHDRIQTAMDDGSDLPTGSWSQRNATLYSTICDTLDLSKNGSDLDILQVVDENNGVGLHDILQFRLREIKSSDPLAHAIQLRMGIQHIKYSPKPHGVDTYFKDIDRHRAKLGDLPRPKIIPDWEVVAKAIRELPSLHEKFKEAASVLSLQRKLSKCDTTLQECRDAFVNADNDNKVYADLKQKKSPGKTNKRVRINITRNVGPPHRDSQRKSGQQTQYKAGDCVHHPLSVSHTTPQCRDPFGLTSAFSRAISYTDKCRAIRASIAAGWSPRATHVKIPQGYGSDSSVQHTPTTEKSKKRPPPLQINHVATTNINDDDMRAYYKVRALIGDGDTPKRSAPAHPTPPASTPNHACPPVNVQNPPAPGVYHAPTAPPVRAFHASTTHSFPYPTREHLPPPAYRPTAYQPPFSYHVGHPHSQQMPPSQPVRTNTAGILPPPSDDDLIAAGLRYYANQAGHQQHFR